MFQLAILVSQSQNLTLVTSDSRRNLILMGQEFLDAILRELGELAVLHTHTITTQRAERQVRVG